ncbi:autophagy protein 7 [Cavenderia fasciculata]|uniref:Ubiquitin-like modifier-activating enzyme ATG7 n=1 Tax=Cavenderia fasciculata TaxID=261658 RepID=F4PTH6_CACFS|nr:autophagy protein 7 [Cavenderia fasciculata]EGG20858.1 autophagy protein 7 [Cavenderia fasciculata]|eukprot:XP_004358708.1 autophagy protein 7 [Cavenderia fasciculata]
MSILQFKEFSSFINISFWNELAQKKLNIFKLSDAPVNISAFYTYSSSAQLDPFLSIEYNSFLPLTSSNEGDSLYKLPPKSYLSNGIIYNYNTKEDFKQAPKQKIFEDVSLNIWNDIKNGNVERDSSLLSRFLILTFADIKNHQFYYLVGVPALSFESPITLRSPVQPINEYFTSNQVASLKGQLVGSQQQFFLIRKEGQDSVEVASLDKWSSFVDEAKNGTLIVGFSDPCSLPSNPGWPLRNFLYYIGFKQIKDVDVVCIRDVKGQSIDTSIVLQLALPETPTEWSKKSVGWEKDPNGKILPRLISLASTMDPLKLATQSVDLNLKLMRWRIMPSLDLELIQNTKCLLLGSGTLGCNVARCLLSWGVRNITFVDSGKVSYSNPVRQSLFNFEDCTGAKGKDKAPAAAENLKKVFPAVNANSEILSIPMPGHSVAEGLKDEVKAVYDKLVDLIQQHDVIFLLTDSRESRWLPTVLGRLHNKLVINSALGFDTFLVGRHGSRVPNANEKEGSEGVDLGCYFCNDVIAPTDTLKDRTLDQQCTVTRPGLSFVASSMAVELMVSVLHHPLQGRAPAETDQDIHSGSSTPLGILPHQLRGFLSHFSALPVYSTAYKNCTACSNGVVDELEKRGFDFVHEVLNDSSCLTKYAGIDQYEDAGVTIEWDEDFSGDDEDL